MAIINIKELQNALGLVAHKWKSAENDQIYDVNQLIIPLKKENDDIYISIHLNNKNLNSFTLHIEENNLSSNIIFDQITGFFPYPKMRLIIVESKSDQSFSQIRISYNGQFTIQCNIPIERYKNAWSQLTSK